MNHHLSIKEVISRCEYKIVKLKGTDMMEEAQKVIEQINKLDITLTDKETLLSIAYSIAVILVPIGQHVADSSMYHNASYFCRKIKGARVSFDYEGTVKDKEAQEKLKTENEYQEEIYYNYRNEILKYLHDDLSRIVTILQTIIKNRP